MMEAQAASFFKAVNTALLLQINQLPAAQEHTMI